MPRRKRRKRFKIKLTKKQKQRFVFFVGMALCLFGTFLFFQLHQPAPKKTSTPPSSAIRSSSRPKAQTKPIPKTRTNTQTATRTVTRTTTPTTTPSKIRTTTRTSTRTTTRLPRGPKISFVIDDIGNNNLYTSQLRALGRNVTYAILPLLPYSRYYGNLSRTTGAEVILHLPLDTVQNKVPGRGLIVDTMSENDILAMLSRDLDSVPYLVGVNNHMGSRGTANRSMMTIILRELKQRGLFFLDSYTTAESVVPSVGRAIGIPLLTRGVFLDNTDSKPEILAQIRSLREVARKTGNAIAIGHYRANTLEVLAQEIPRLKREGLQIITLEQMLTVQQD